MVNPIIFLPNDLTLHPCSELQNEPLSTNYPIADTSTLTQTALINGIHNIKRNIP
jgi:hypothetical protein